MNTRFDQFYFEAPADRGSAPAGLTQPAPGATEVPPQGAPESNGQGDPANEGFWNMFPDVPAEHRPLLEPHIKAMQGHVTKLETQLAPFKPFLEANVKPEEAAGLLKFSQDFDQAPLDMWLRMGQMLQSQEEPIIDPEVDLEYLAYIARGEEPPEETEAPAPVANGNGLDQSNPLAATVQELQAQIEQLKQDRQREQATRQEAIQNKLLENRMNHMREELKKAGYPEDLLTDDAISARILVHRGKVDAAIKSFIDERAGILKGFTQSKEQDELELPNGVPTDVPERPRPKDGSWGVARAKASSRLRRANQAAAQ